ncbi:RNA recognition domain-containing protein [Coniochaeta sp. 2T2.1]|nr:RNA recognition domain-containing protein [Coniochaeta sp. 2T2.1]
MTDQTPEVVAAVDVSPVSPKPIHTSATSPALVPSLQDYAATLDVAYLDSLTTAPFPFVTMPSTRSRNPSNPANPAVTAAQDSSPQSSPAADTIVVCGEEEDDDHSDDSHHEEADIDEESLDAYGLDDDRQQQDDDPQHEHAAEFTTAESTTGVTNGTVTETTRAAQPDVTEASSESMINTPSANSTPESNVVMKSESPAAATSQLSEFEGGVVSADRATENPAPEGDSQVEPQKKLDSSPTAASESLAPPANTAVVKQEEDPIAIDIQKLVNDITAANAAASSPATTAPSQAAVEATSLPVKQENPSSISLPQPSSLPLKPVFPQDAAQPASRPQDFHPFPSRGANNSHAAPPMPMQGVVHSQAAPSGNSPYTGAAAPGTTAAAVSSLPPIPPAPLNNGPQAYSSLPIAASIPGSVASRRGDLHGAQLQQAWELFQEDEKRYLTEAKWERFPENSRIFIGNLSNERVSKREVFDLFHRFGRLAQISLKSAYGFVQYHLAEDAEAAMQSAQGAEMGGRRIHLEFSRVQKKKEPQDRDMRDRSPDRRSQRSIGGPVGGGLDRYDGRDRNQNRRRDDYRRSPSPRRGDSYGRGGRDRYRDGSYDRHSRPRSRSPRSNRNESDSYRRRSPSPRKRGPPEPNLDIPQRYGDQVPDVQILLLGELQQDFIAWVQRAFYERGLKADVMYFNPRFARDAVLQKLVVEGVHGVIELDMRAQTTGKIPLQVFARSSGSNVRFDQYQDLDPKVAAELVLRAKPPQAPPAQPQQPAYPAYPPNPYPQYPQPYPPQHPLPQGVPPSGYPYTQPPPTAPQGPAALTAQDIAGLAGRVDNNTLQALLASLSGGQQPAPQPGMPPQVDINALLGSLQGGVAPPIQPQALSYGGYMPQMGGTPVQPAGPHNLPPAGGGAGPADTAAQVQNIMASLARQR